MTVRAPSPLAAAVGLAAATADELRKLPARLPSLLSTARGAARERYDELALHGQDVLARRTSARPAEAATERVTAIELVEPATGAPEPAPPILPKTTPPPADLG